MIRHKENLQYRSIKEYELPDGRHEHVLMDELIKLTGDLSHKKYPSNFAEWPSGTRNQQVIELITNQHTSTANKIAELYKKPLANRDLLPGN